MIVNKHQSFSTKRKLDENGLTYHVHTNLDSKYSSDFERYSQEYDLFDIEANRKYSLHSIMQHFQNAIRNLNSLEKSVIFMVAIIPNVAFVSPNQQNS